MLALRAAAPLRLSVRALSTSARLSAGPSQASGDDFKKRERGEEERYVRASEAEKLKALQKSIDASKAHLAQLEKDHAELTKSSEKK